MNVIKFAFCACITLALAAPHRQDHCDNSQGETPDFAKLTDCNVTNAQLALPSNAFAANLSVPANERPLFIALGVGVQNYTCKNGTYANNMALATLYDASCVYGTYFYSKLPHMAVDGCETAALPVDVQDHIGDDTLGYHFYQHLTPNATTTNPVFDFRSTKKGDYFAGKKIANISSPDGPKNIPWVELAHIQGSLAQTVIRVQTAGGSPPSNVSCTEEGKIITSKYAAYYWMFK